MIRAGVVNRLILVFLVSSFNVANAEDCTSWVAKAISIQGDVERRSNTDQSTSQWQSIKRDDQLCAGEIIRVKQNSRAALILKNDTILRLNQNTTITLSSLSEDQSHWINLEQGIAHFIARIKQTFKVITPFVNAAVEGTEFVVSVNATQSEITVFEGRVNVSNDLGEVKLTKGQTAITADKSKPTLTLKIKPRDAVQWSLYYPAIINFDSVNYQNLNTATKTIMERSIASAHNGNFNTSLKQLRLISDSGFNSILLIYRASLYLSVGQIKKAKIDILQVIKQQPDNADALALQAIIAIVQNDKTKALSLAEQAVTLAPDSATTTLALSYVHQSLFDINSALEIIKTATTKNKDNALLWSRLSELYLMIGDLNKALEAATKANNLNPNIARTHSALGFAYLSKIEVKKAQQAFNDAIRINDSDPLSRLGLGLAIIRQGDLVKGRREIEYAATLDPNNALIRSYLGKAYYEEKRDKLAAVQFKMAKELDPNDPTGYLYDAIFKQSINRPVEALADLEKSIKLNNNLSVYRSQFLLDNDHASKTTNRGKIYSDLGYEQLAIKDATESIINDPTNHAAHRFLSEMYSKRQRHELAVVSEQLQSQLYQPISNNPIQPQYSIANLGIVNTNSGFNNYDSLFERDQNNLYLNGFSGTNNTKSYDAIMSTLQGGFSFSIGTFDYKTDGYRENNDQSEKINNIHMQYSFTPNFNVFYEYKGREFDGGDINQKFGETNFKANLRESLKNINRRFSFNYKMDIRNQLIFTYDHTTADYFRKDLLGPNLSHFNSTSSGTSSEIQHIHISDKYNIITGLGRSNRDGETKFEIFGLGVPFVIPGETSSKFENIYIYSPLTINENHLITIGASYDSINEPKIIDKNLINPKFGYTFNSFNTTFRLAAFKTLYKPFNADQTIEPTQVAGFNQFFDELNGTESKHYGIGLDQYINNRWNTGIELNKRDKKKHLITESLKTTLEKKQKEYLHRLYLHWLPNKYLTTGLQYIYEDFESGYDPSKGNSTNPALMTTQHIPLQFNYFHPIGLFLNWTTTYVDQDVSFVVANQGLDSKHDSFDITDISIGYKFPKRYGTISFGAKNVFDQKFQFHNINPVTSKTSNIKYYPEQFLFVSLQFNI